MLQILVYSILHFVQDSDWVQVQLQDERMGVEDFGDYLAEEAVIEFGDPFKRSVIVMKTVFEY